MRTSIKIYVAKLLYYILIFFRIKKDNLVSRKSIKWHLDISEGIDLSIFLFGSFQGSVVQSIINFILKKKLKRKSKFTIIDVGSNIGDKSLSLAKNLLDQNFTNFRIFSIEPTDYAFKKQIRNINLNPTLKKKIFSFKSYVSDKKMKPSKIYSSWKLNSNSESHKVHKGFLKKVDKSTKVISLDNFIKKNKIKGTIILKVDVDGFEMNVLKSCQKALKDNSPIIFMEYAPYTMIEKGFSVLEFKKFIEKYNYSVFDLNFKELNNINISSGSSTDVVLIKNN
jgi:FkbM family methyltransferase